MHGSGLRSYPNLPLATMLLAQGWGPAHAYLSCNREAPAKVQTNAGTCRAITAASKCKPPLSSHCDNILYHSGHDSRSESTLIE